MSGVRNHEVFDFFRVDCKQPLHVAFLRNNQWHSLCAVVNYTKHIISRCGNDGEAIYYFTGIGIGPGIVNATEAEGRKLVGEVRMTGADEIRYFVFWGYVPPLKKATGKYEALAFDDCLFEIVGG